MKTLKISTNLIIIVLILLTTGCQTISKINKNRKFKTVKTAEATPKSGNSTLKTVEQDVRTVIKDVEKDVETVVKDVKQVAEAVVKDIEVVTKDVVKDVKAIEKDVKQVKEAVAMDSEVVAEKVETAIKDVTVVGKDLAKDVESTVKDVEVIADKASEELAPIAKDVEAVAATVAKKLVPVAKDVEHVSDEIAEKIAPLINDVKATVNKVAETLTPVTKELEKVTEKTKAVEKKAISEVEDFTKKLEEFGNPFAIKKGMPGPITSGAQHHMGVHLENENSTSSSKRNIGIFFIITALLTLLITQPRDKAMHNDSDSTLPPTTPMVDAKAFMEPKQEHSNSTPHLQIDRNVSSQATDTGVAPSQKISCETPDEKHQNPSQPDTDKVEYNIDKPEKIVDHEELSDISRRIGERFWDEIK